MRFLTFSGQTVINVVKQRELSLVASSPLCDSVLVEIKCINVGRYTTVALRPTFIHLISTSMNWLVCNRDVVCTLRSSEM
jgi:hypothetical protein